LHFVRETKPPSTKEMVAYGFYRLCLVTKGRGLLHTAAADYSLEVGDVFFQLPGVPSSLEYDERLEYMYIGYVGAYAQALTDSLRLSDRRCYFSDFSHLLDLWKSAIKVNAPFADFAAEGVLLFTLADMGSRMGAGSDSDRQERTAFTQIKKHIDDRFADPDLSLEQMAHDLNYNAKYISTLFKRRMQVGVAEYISILRVQQACTLMEEGITSVKDISFLCGFRDPLYFSKVFKSRMGVSPRGHIAELANKSGKDE